MQPGWLKRRQPVVIWHQPNIINQTVSMSKVITSQFYLFTLVSEAIISAKQWLYKQAQKNFVPFVILVMLCNIFHERIRNKNPRIFNSFYIFFFHLLFFSLISPVFFFLLKSFSLFVIWKTSINELNSILFQLW